MDDFPAGPASPGPRRPPLSVVIPVRDGGPDFEGCLRALRDSSHTDFEIVVVDDASRDDSAKIAEAMGAVVLRNAISLGPAAARNQGAEAARAPLIFFLDADVSLHADAIERALVRFRADPNLGALFGSYDDRPTARGLASQFRNLLHHYVHQQGEFENDARSAHTFWTGCGAIRRAAFWSVGGFDPNRYRRPAIEDIELGYRLTSAGYRILLARDVLATHRKRWTFMQILRTDVFQRGVPWMLLMLRSGVAESDLNVSRGQRASVTATGFGIAALSLSPWLPWLPSITLLTLLAQAVLNRHFYGFLARRRGWGFAVASFPLHYAYFCCCGISVAVALALHHFPWRRTARAVPSAHGRVDAAELTAVPRLSTRKIRRPSPWKRT
jgi:glycosyltransferase involved in cell wall biosynthesis